MQRERQLRQPFRPRALQTALLALVVLLLAPDAVCAAGDLELVNARIRLNPAGGGPHAGYFTLLNHGPGAVRLVGASSPGFSHVMMHRSVTDGGTARMEALPGGVKVAAGGRVDFAPLGRHLMLMGARHRLAVGQAIPVTLHFADGTSLTVDFAVVALRLD